MILALIINAWMKATSFFLYEEEHGQGLGSGRLNVALLQHFLHIFYYGLLLKGYTDMAPWRIGVRKS